MCSLPSRPCKRSPRAPLQHTDELVSYLLAADDRPCVPCPQRDLCPYFAGALSDLRGPMAPTSMSESHPFLWKATKTRRPPRPAFTGRAAGAPGRTENCVCCSPLPPPRAAARNTELLNILNHFRFNRCLTGGGCLFSFFFFFGTLVLALSGCL